MKLLIQGAESATTVPGIEKLPDNIDVVFAGDSETVARELPGTEVFLAWNFRDSDLKNHWDKATNLKWIHWGGAGVDAALFDELAQSDVILTNAKGIFDRAMAETALGYMLMVCKDFRLTLDHQQSRTWEYRITRKLQGDRALIVGVGSIGRDIARLLNANGVQCSGAGRSARPGDGEFDEIFESEKLIGVINQFQWVIGIMPSTADTVGFFNANLFTAMNPNAHFISLGRGNAVVESDLIAALENNDIAGAMLDVFENEPLDESDPIWHAKNLFISPHISGDYSGFQEDMVQQFLDNLDRYQASEPMINIVDKQLGFVAGK